MSQEHVETPIGSAEKETAEFYNERGSFHSASGKYDQAIEWFDKTIKKVPQAEQQLRLAAFEGAGMALRRLRRFDEAEEMFQQELEAAEGAASGALLVQQGWLSFYQKFYAE